MAVGKWHATGDAPCSHCALPRRLSATSTRNFFRFPRDDLICSFSLSLFLVSHRRPCTPVLLLSFLICHEPRHPPRWYEIEPLIFYGVAMPWERGLPPLSLIQLYKASLRGRTTTLYCYLRGESSTPLRILTLLTLTIPPSSLGQGGFLVGYFSTGDDLFLNFDFKSLCLPMMSYYEWSLLLLISLHIMLQYIHTMFSWRSVNL